ncbi:hypothetical protein NQ314_018083 [Rhamnusium bicolor]|uniref:DDE Tnp4 domain-containing protein n=1 Tax=Rhamnusium bicolor TaxID=1586634 RepID=A0AAV8WSI6_9CUCU|nr:hypothetical protein NQ314_018083 [Rhamnusium bicolor]
MTNIGSYGKEGDIGILVKSNMGERIRREINFQHRKKIPGSNITVPHFIVGDEAFRLGKYMMKSYTKAQANVDTSKAIYNYRLSRTRRFSKNAFALFTQVFRIFYTPIAVLLETTDIIVTAACCLHNMLTRWIPGDT